MPHTYYFYAEHPITHKRLFKRSYRATRIAMAMAHLIVNLERKGLRVEDYQWSVGRSDKTRQYRALRRAGHSIKELFWTHTDFVHPTFNGTDKPEEILSWLTRVEREEWDKR